MLRATALAITTAALLATSGASAQVIDLGGRGGPSIDLRSDRERDREFRRDEERRDRARARAYDDGPTGSVGCKTVTVRERDDDGRMVTRTTQRCR